MEKKIEVMPVYLVGAGPGDPELLTLKGRRLLSEAEVVVYDQLANEALLRLVPDAAEKIDVGKKAGRHTLPQDQINQLLVEKARTGKKVVRLKGGDPFVFGRGGEEAEYLLAHGCGYEVVPGVTSAVAVPAYAGIPVTHRSLTSTVTFITGHEAGEQSRLDWAHLARDTGTQVFLMGLGNLPRIAQNLMHFGRDAKTPAAVIAHGTHNDQQTVTGTLADIAAKVQQARLPTPAIIVVGEVVRLRETLHWLEKRPLFQKKVLVTRAEEQAEALAQALRARGAVPLVCPLIAIRPRKVAPQIWQQIQAGVYSWLIFTSVNGVRLFGEALWSAGLDARSLGSCRIAAMGEKTAQALQGLGLRADIVPQVYQAETLADALLCEVGPGERILLPRASKTREVLTQKLREAGCETEELPLYDTEIVRENAARLRQLLAEADYVTLASSSAVQAFFACVSPQEYAQIQADRPPEKGKLRMAAIGPITAASLEKEGVQAEIVPQKYTLEALIEAMENNKVQ